MAPLFLYPSSSKPVPGTLRDMFREPVPAVPGTEITGNWRKGFTFIELLVVLILIGIFFTVSLPELKTRFEHALLNQEARTATQFLRYAQYRAIADRLPVSFMIQTHENQYQIMKDEGASGRSQWTAVPGEWGKPVRLKSQFIVEPAFEGIVYFPDGSSSGGSFSLKFKKISAHFTIKPGLGHVKVDFEKEK